MIERRRYAEIEEDTKQLVRLKWGRWFPNESFTDDCARLQIEAMCAFLTESQLLDLQQFINLKIEGRRYR